MESQLNYRVTSHLSVTDPGVTWLLEYLLKQRPEQSGHLKHGVWLISLGHVCRQEAMRINQRVTVALMWDTVRQVSLN